MCSSVARTVVGRFWTEIAESYESFQRFRGLDVLSSDRNYRGSWMAGGRNGAQTMSLLANRRRLVTDRLRIEVKVKELPDPIPVCFG